MPRLITLVLLAWLCGPAFAADYSPFDLSQTLGLSAPAAEQAPPRESVPPEDATAPGSLPTARPHSITR
ncbi:MAG: hypothetical protein IPL00_16725 [Gammaproteobacteria bacterium]|nr:hypothetical protein [Gammaproteobacteria bacterium]